MIQVDIPMPPVCDKCLFMDDDSDYPYCMALQESRGYTFRIREKRFPNCPLKEIKPIKPVRDNRIWLCGNCGDYVGFEDNDPSDPNEYDNFCRKCGMPVLWEKKYDNNYNNG